MQAQRADEEQARSFRLRGRYNYDDDLRQTIKSFVCHILPDLNNSELEEVQAHITAELHLRDLGVEGVPF